MRCFLPLSKLSLSGTEASQWHPHVRPEAMGKHIYNTGAAGVDHVRVASAAGSSWPRGPAVGQFQFHTSLPFSPATRPAVDPRVVLDYAPRARASPPQPAR